MVVKMNAKGVGTALLARELALDVAEALYEPLVCTHIPGVANVLADFLSRRGSHGYDELPAPLRRANARQLPARDLGLWRTV